MGTWRSWTDGLSRRPSPFRLPLRYPQQLHKRRCDLLDTNLDLLEDIGNDAEDLHIIMADIHANRRAVEAINRIRLRPRRPAAWA